MAADKGEVETSNQAEQQCLEMLTWAMDDLGIAVAPAQQVAIATLIINSMTGPWREYHLPNHIFEVGARGDAIEVLAALFHDLIYVQVDQSVRLNLSGYIVPFVQEAEGHLVVRQTPELPEDQQFQLVAHLFGIAPGQVLSPVAGQNEFLSALVAAKVLSPLLPIGLIAQIAVCIEATVPFRAQPQPETTVSDQLYQRLQTLNQQMALGLDTPAMIQAVQRAVRLANRDVENFADPSSARFLDNTWSLLPETNHSLRNLSSYTVRQYRLALQKMEGFMQFLRPELVFRQFQGEPDDATYTAMLQYAQRNIAIARLYLGTKLVSIAILEALSSCVGRDVPLSTLIGELPSVDPTVARWEQVFPKLEQPYAPTNEVEQAVLDLLEQGRSQDIPYDTKNSPLSAFIVKSIGFEQTQVLLARSQRFFQGQLSAWDYLTECDSGIIETVANGVIQLFANRQTALRFLLSSYRNADKKPLDEAES